jgi:ribonuclease HI
VANSRYYVVWEGRKRGIFSSWLECENLVKGFVGAEYKGFGTLEEARRAFKGTYEDYRGKSASMGKWKTARVKPGLPSLSVDAACSGSPGRLEFRGVDTGTGKEIFKGGPYADGTNNVGEFLAIVEALRWLRTNGLDWPIYSDSANAISWVQAKKCNTKLAHTSANHRLFETIAAAEKTLRQDAVSSASVQPRLLKWDTAAWGEIPADFGRK